VDKSINRLIALRIKWWPGTESNHRHADFQGVQRLTCNHLSGKAAENSSALRTPAFLAGFAHEFPANVRPFLASEVQP
jgi:hypothetical protein